MGPNTKGVKNIAGVYYTPSHTALMDVKDVRVGCNICSTLGERRSNSNEVSPEDRTTYSSSSCIVELSGSSRLLDPAEGPCEISDFPRAIWSVVSSMNSVGGGIAGPRFVHVTWGPSACSITANEPEKTGTSGPKDLSNFNAADVERARPGILMQIPVRSRSVPV